MKDKLLSYWKSSYRHLIPALLTCVLVSFLPPFRLFGERSASMVEVHLLLELFAFMVAGFIAMVCWQDLGRNQNARSGLILFGSSLVAMLDLVHAMAYDGMPSLLVANSSTRSIFFWLLGRTVVALTLLAIVLRIRIDRPRSWWLGLAILVGAAATWIGSYRLDWLPSVYVKGEGVTSFKRGYEYTLLLADILLAYAFIYRSSPKNKEVFFALATSCLIIGMGETQFTSYVTTSDFSNIFGHLFKVVSYGFLYQSVAIAAIERPYRRLQESEARFRALTELSSDWYWEQDAKLRFTELSANALGTRNKVPLGKKRWELDIRGISPHQLQAHREAVERHEPFRNFEYQVSLVNDEAFWLTTSGIPVYSKSGEFLGYRGISSDITERKKTAQQIEFLAYHDALTGLANRLRLQERFGDAREHAMRAGHKMALLFLDQDEFKSINDSLGHEVGDDLLRQVATRLNESVRNTDTVCRLGGDEFLILLPEIQDVDEVVTVLAKLMERLQQPFHLNDQELSTSVSVGVAVFPGDGGDFDTLRRHADMAMYRAKDAGRNAYRFFDDLMTNEATEYLVLRNGLRKALGNREFELHYQPQIDLKTQSIVGVEALLRWTSSQMGAVSPARFIPVAEKSGLIVPIGEWVLFEACRRAVDWQQAGLPALRMAVNLSAVQFKRGDIEGTVRRALEESGLRPDLLELELTESILIHDAEIALDVIKSLKQLGVKISIDDFGIGYSSLAYLKRFDIDKLKIDQSFVRNLATDRQDAAIVQAIIRLAHDLDLTTVAEGVESQEVLDRLHAFRCDEVQGYYFSKPVPATGVARLLQEPVVQEGLSPQGEGAEGPS